MSARQRSRAAGTKRRKFRNRGQDRRSVDNCDDEITPPGTATHDEVRHHVLGELRHWCASAASSKRAWLAHRARSPATWGTAPTRPSTPRREHGRSRRWPRSSFPSISQMRATMVPVASVTGNRPPCLRSGKVRDDGATWIMDASISVAVRGQAQGWVGHWRRSPRTDLPPR